MGIRKAVEAIGNNHEIIGQIIIKSIVGIWRGTICKYTKPSTAPKKFSYFGDNSVPIFLLNKALLILNTKTPALSPFIAY
jgi:hypothetical protein